METDNIVYRDNIKTEDETDENEDEIDIYVLIEIEHIDDDLGNFAFVDCNVEFGFTQSEVHESQDHLKQFYSIFSKFKDVDNGIGNTFLYPNFNCFKCRLSFTSQEALYRHCQEHPSEVIYDCDMCKKSYISSENLALHKPRCQAERYCTHCNRSFASVKTLKAHIGLVHAPREKRYQCGTCDRRFVHPGFLEKHLRKHSGARPYRCEVCNKNFIDKATLRKHSLTHIIVKPFKCDICGRDFARNTGLIDHRRRRHFENYPCTLCPELFATKVQLTQHQSEHSEYETYSCTTCPKKFVSETSLKLHQRTHSAVRRYPCTLCTKVFSYRSCLTQHMRTHSGERPHQCEICSKTFALAGNLRSHMRTHTGARPFACGVCAKSFAERSTLKQHQTVHTGEKPFECDVCRKRFRIKKGLISHWRSAKNVECAREIAGKLATERNIEKTQ